MNDRVICFEEQVGTNFLALEMECDCSEYCVSIDGEVLIRNKKKNIADRNYDILKENVLARRYVREGLLSE